MLAVITNYYARLADFQSIYTAAMRTTCLTIILSSLLTICACAPKLQPIYESQKAVASYIDNGGYLNDFLAVVKEARHHLSSVAAGTDNNLAIVLGMGDQESDIFGGFCERGFKLPNPVYYLL